MGPEGREGPHIPGQGRSPVDKRAVKRLLAKHGLSADRRLGQHFLISEKTVQAIVARTAGAAGVLEVGPGVGALTSALLETATKVVAIELDERVLAALTEVASEAEIVRADVLKTDVASILDRLPGPRCLVSNMPYSITGPLLTKVAESRGLFRNAVLMMQREVGRRVLAGPGTSERGSLSVYMQLQFEITKVCDVPAEAFWPQPKVDSVVLDLVPRKTGLDEAKEQDLFKLVRTGFTQPRKTLVNNIADDYGKQAVEQALDSLEHRRNVRPHQIDNKGWLALAEAL